LLIQTGEIDNVTQLESIRNCFSENTNATIAVFKNAYHGFDVASLPHGKTIRFLPLLGKKYVFKYNPEAAQKAENNLFDFLLRK
jgi:dienelactone hydrolase